MVAFKKSIALAAFAVAGVSAESGCMSCCQQAPKPDDETGKNANKVEDGNREIVNNGDDDNSASSTVEPEEKTKCEENKERISETAASIKDKASQKKAEAGEACTSIKDKTSKACRNGLDSLKSGKDSVKAFFVADKRFYMQTTKENFADAKDAAKATGAKVSEVASSAKSGVFRGAAATGEAIKNNPIKFTTIMMTLAAGSAWQFADVLGMEGVKSTITDLFNENVLVHVDQQARADLYKKFAESAMGGKCVSCATATGATFSQGKTRAYELYMGMSLSNAKKFMQAFADDMKTKYEHMPTTAANWETVSKAFQKFISAGKSAAEAAPAALKKFAEDQAAKLKPTKKSD